MILTNINNKNINFFLWLKSLNKYLYNLSIIFKSHELTKKSLLNEGS